MVFLTQYKYFSVPSKTENLSSFLKDSKSHSWRNWYDIVSWLVNNFNIYIDTKKFCLSEYLKAISYYFLSFHLMGTCLISNMWGKFPITVEKLMPSFFMLVILRKLHLLIGFFLIYQNSASKTSVINTKVI